MTSTSFSRIITKLRRSFSLPRHLLTPSPQSSSSSSSCRAVSSISESQSVSSPLPQEKQRGSRWSKWLLFFPGAITFGLGTWQIIRRQEKMKMLEYRQKRLEKEPLNLNSIPLRDKLDTLEFRRICCKGVFDEKRSIYVGPRSRSISGVTENGYYVITPLIPVTNNPQSMQSPILVNRGWVPRSWKDNASEVGHRVNEQPSDVTLLSNQDDERSSWWRFWSKKSKNIEDQVPPVTPIEVIGVVRGSEKPSIYVPANDPISGQWFYVDVPAIARACGLPDDTIYIEDINENVNPSNPYPVPKDINTLIRSSVMPQDHLNYTLTWYSLSAAVTFMAFKRLTQKKSGRLQ